MTTEQLSENDYISRAQETLRALIDALDELGSDGFEAELANDIVTVEFPDGTKYIINSHRAARQIWMAAERSAWHFDFDLGTSAWVAHKSNDELWSTVEAMLGKKLGVAIALPRG